jgi:NAD(P)-dependent dehydrogenase (short-subunit alcohol dehydrogenase family)
MKAKRAGVIVNVIGAAGEKYPTNYIAGATGNASLYAFTRALGRGAPADGLRVVAISPGPVETDRLVMLRRAEAQEKFGDPERWRELTSSMPYGRAATPREIGNAVAFMASSASAYTNATIVTIDGGG